MLKLLGSQDLVAVAKLLNLPYKPYFMPHLPLLPSFETRKLFGLPPLPNQLNSAMNSITVTESPPTAPSRTTLAPLLRLLTLTPFTLPPPPKIDSYGINTIPELPPQHESIYVGMFAPDGSLIKKNETTVQETEKQTETNEIYSKEEFVRKTHGRGTREAAAIPILSDQTIHDDLHLDDDENVLSELEESKNLANFLRQNAPKAEDFSQQTTELAETTGTIPSPDEATTASTFRLASLNTDAVFSSSGEENAGTKVKVTTLTRLPIFISRENDPFMMKHRELVAFHGEGDNNMLQRISPQPRNNLPLRMLPIRSMSHRCLTERNDQLKNECKLKSYNLNRTTMQPTKITYTMNQKVKEENAAKAFGSVNHNVRYAKNLPLKIEIKRAEQFLSDSATDLHPSQQMQSKNAAREKPRIELNSTPSPDEFTQQYDDESITAEVERTIPQLRDGELNRKPRPVTNEMFSQVGNEDVRPTNVLPIAKALPQEIPATQAVVAQSVTSKLAPQQQQRVLSWTQTTGPQFLVTPTPSRVQHLPVIQHYYQNAYYKQQQFPARDPQDEMYLRELEEYDHLWSAEHVRATSYFHPVIPAPLPPYQQYSQAGSDGAALQQINRAVSRTGPYVQQQQQPLQNSLSSIRLQLRNVTYLSTPAPQFYNSINSLSRAYSTNHQSLQQPSDVQSSFVKKPLPNPFAIKLGPLLQNFAGGLFGIQPQI